MLIPLGTDRLPRHRPTITITLVVVNLLVFIGVAAAVRAGSTTHEQVIAWGAVSRTDFQPWSLVTSLFLHDPTGLGHVGFNMLFLWVFGQAVEARLGSLGFAAFYLVGGVAACLAHMMVTPFPAIGGSGAVAAVSNAERYAQLQSSNTEVVDLLKKQAEQAKAMRASQTTQYR